MSSTVTVNASNVEVDLTPVQATVGEIRLEPFSRHNVVAVVPIVASVLGTGEPRSETSLGTPLVLREEYFSLKQLLRTALDQLEEMEEQAEHVASRRGR